MLPRNRFLRSPEGVCLTAVLIIFALYYLAHEQDGELSSRVQRVGAPPDGGVVLLKHKVEQKKPLQHTKPKIKPTQRTQHALGHTQRPASVGLHHSNTDGPTSTPRPTPPRQNDTELWPCGVDPSNTSAVADVSNYSMRCDVSTPSNNVAEELGNLILDLTEIQKRDYKSYLRQQLCSASKGHLEKLWLQITDFASKYACKTCIDRRPPPRTALPPTARLPTSSKAKSKDEKGQQPVLVVQPGGRLGNQMGEYATALALHNIFNVTVYLAADMHANLSAAFPAISIPPIHINSTDGSWTQLGKDGGCSVRRYRNLELAAAGLLGPGPFVMAAYPFEMQLFNAYKRQIVREFKFHPKIMAKARARLQNFTQLAAAGRLGAAGGDIVSVGVHIRLSDYPGFMKREFRVGGLAESYSSYLRRAAAYFRRRYSSVVFVVTSDDVAAAAGLMAGVAGVFLSNGTAQEDMCLLTLCQHTIITFGTFGFWGGYLGRGTTLYPHLHYPPNTRYMLTRTRYAKAKVTHFVPVPFYAP